MAAAAKKDMSEQALKALERTEGAYAANVIRAENRFKQSEAKNKTLQERFDTFAQETKKKFKEWSQERSLRIAAAGAGGMAAGAAVAYAIDGFVVEKLGTGIFSLILIPGVGLLVAALAPAIKDKGEKSMAETRAGVFGFGIGLALMGGYMSYQRWG